MNPQVRVTRPGPFAWFFRLVKKAPMEDIDSADAGDVGNKANKGPVDSEELADLKDSLVWQQGVTSSVFQDRHRYLVNADVLAEVTNFIISKSVK